MMHAHIKKNWNLFFEKFKIRNILRPDSDKIKFFPWTQNLKQKFSAKQKQKNK